MKKVENKPKEQQMNELINLREKIAEFETYEKKLKLKEKKATHLNVALSSFKNLNLQIHKKKDIQHLAKHICNNLIKKQSYSTAWIVLFNSSGYPELSANAGFENNFMMMLKQIKDGKLINCAQKALSQSDVVVTKKPFFICQDCPLSNMYDGRIALTVRIGLGQKIYGLLSVSVPMNLLSDEEDKNLLFALSRDIFFALDNIYCKEKKEKLEDTSLQSEYKYHTLFDDSKDAVYITSWNGDIVDVNQSFLDLFDYTREEIKSRTVWDLYVNPNDRIKFQNEIGKKLSLRDFELKLKKKDGTIMDCLLTSTLRQTNQGNILGYQGIIRDITEHRKAEKELQEREERYRTFFETSRDCIFISTKDGHWVDTNQATVELFGYKNKGELLKAPVTEIYKNPKDREGITRSMERGDAKDVQLNFRKRDGTVINVLVTGIARRDKNGNVVGYQGTFKDITETKKVKEAYQESEKFNSTLLNNSPNPILVINPDTSIRYINKALEKLTGFTSAEIIGRKAPYPWWTKEKLKKTKADLDKAIYRGIHKLEKDFKKENGTPFTVEINSVPITSNNKLKYSIVNWVDITERKRAEYNLTKKERQLKNKTLNLEEVNTALKVLLKRRAEDKNDLEKKVVFNVRELVLPYLEKLKESGLNETQNSYAEILETNLNDIISPFSARLSASYLHFTPTELQVASLVKHGKTTKDIAILLNLSTQTIESHRKNIRKKIGIKNKKGNLRMHLLSIE